MRRRPARRTAPVPPAAAGQARNAGGRGDSGRQVASGLPDSPAPLPGDLVQPADALRPGLRRGLRPGCPGRPPAGQPTSRTRRAGPSSAHHSSPRSQTNGKRPAGSRMPGRRSAAPRRPSSRRANRPMGSGIDARGSARSAPSAGCGPGRRWSASPRPGPASRICSAGTRPKSFTLRTGPSQATQASETIRVARIAEVLDRGDQRHVQSARGQTIGQPAGQIDDHLGRGASRAQAVDQRPGVEIRYHTDPHWRSATFGHCSRRRASSV